LKGKLPDDVKGRNKSHFCFFSSEGLLDCWQPRGTVEKSGEVRDLLLTDLSGIVSVFATGIF